MHIPVFLEEGFKSHWIETGIDDNEYHADKSAVSSTALRAILKSEKSFLLAHNETNERTKAMILGTAVHMAILEPEKFKSVRVGKASTKEKISSISLILSEEEYEEVTGMATSAMRHPDVANILDSGSKTEITGYYRDPATGIKCRIRPDLFGVELMTLLDVKTTLDSSKEAFSRSIWNYRYDFQMAMYCYGIAQITGKNVEYPMFLAIEKKPPYECALYMADEEMVSRGLADYHIAISKLKTAILKNEWTGRQTRIEPISLPKWIN